MGWIFILVIVLYLFASLRVLKQYERGVVFLLGRFAGIRGPGLTLIFVPIQQMVRVSLRTVTMQIPSQKIITRDNVSIDIAAVAAAMDLDAGGCGGGGDRASQKRRRRRRLQQSPARNFHVPPLTPAGHAARPWGR